MKRWFTLWLFSITLLIGVPAVLSAQENTASEEKGLSFETSYTGDNVNNLKGGIRKGSCYLGLANIRINYNTTEAGLWKGGQFYLNGANTHGACPSEQLIGDMQIASNIEAGNHTFLQELWYKQEFGATELTIGLQDLNVQFANTENGALFLNSSFGILPTISGNIPAPVYPLTSLGVSAKWNASKNIVLSGAVYDGCPTDFDHNPYNLNWQFQSGDGLLAISEVQYSTQIKSLSGTYKLGVYSHNHWFANGNESTKEDGTCINNFGLYAIADQMLWQRENKGLGSFVQIGYGPAKYNRTFFYLGTGINVNGLFSKKEDDKLGIGIALAWLKGNIGNETTIELTYKRPLMKHIFVQPDFQYIMNPAGLGDRLGNCLEGTLRIGIEF